ncbi:hypothetical protein ACFQ3Z_45415 [Streptomyces nogalater]
MPNPGWHPDETLEKLRTNDRADKGLYRYKARTQSHWSYAGKSGDLWSPYSSWCYFKIDSTAPKAPRITAGSPTPSARRTCARARAARAFPERSLSSRTPRTSTSPGTPTSPPMNTSC